MCAWFVREFDAPEELDVDAAIVGVDEEQAKRSTQRARKLGAFVFVQDQSFECRRKLEAGREAAVFGGHVNEARFVTDVGELGDRRQANGGTGAPFDERGNVVDAMLFGCVGEVRPAELELLGNARAADCEGTHGS